MITNKQQWKKALSQARRGDTDAQYTVGYYYEEGIENGDDVIVKPQILRAFHWYALAAEQGNDSAQLALGRLLSTGEGIRRDFKEAINWTKKALKQGSSSAAINLGTIYRDLKRPAMAFRWYNKAVEMGDLEAYYQVGLCYYFGFGVKTNFKAAYKCFKKIATEGKPPQDLSERTQEDALYWMAIFHLLGIGEVKRSVTKARKLLESADKDWDHEQANEILNLIGKTKYMKA